MRILIVANDVVSTRMAGPGIRCFELGRQLSLAGHEVTVAGIGATDLESERMTIVPPLGLSAMEELARSQDAILLEGFALARYGSLRTLEVPLIVDLYDPFPLALLEQEALRPVGERRGQEERVRTALRDLLAVGDFFLCASERQRDLWVGSLLMAGRINPDTWDDDNSLRHLIDVVPFGVSDEPVPRRGEEARRIMGPNIGSDDLVLLWGGGIYNWFDPLTLVRAVARVALQLPRVKLVFMSTTHPQKGVPARMWMPARTRELSDSLGLTGVHVLFHDEWVRYQDRGRWLAAADCGVSTHFDHAETRYSFRTRILDYLWAGLPIICTEGDVFADMVRDQRLGWVVPPENEDALAAAILALAESDFDREAMRSNVERTAAQMTWPVVSAPLVRYCENPKRAADQARHARFDRSSHSRVARRLAALMPVIRVGLSTLRAEGPLSTGQKAVRWWSRRPRR
jgi:glycosyltransferase involved in cell wall biosynthesis